MPSIIGNIQIFEINNRDISPPSNIYNLLVGTKINTSGYKFFVQGDSYINGLLTSDNINLSNNGNYKINNVIIPQTIITNNGLDLTNGVLKIDLSNNVRQSTLSSTDIFLLQNTNGDTKKITAADLKNEIDTTYTSSGNISISNNNITLNNSISLTGDINTNTMYKINGVQIAMANISDLPNKITAIEGDININTSNISTNTNNISTNTTNIATNTTDITTKQDILTSSSNIDINSVSSTSSLCRNNITLIVNGTNNNDYNNSILFQNTGAAYNWAITRRYDNSITGSNFSNLSIEGGKQDDPQNLTSYFFIKSNGKIGISNTNPVHKLDVTGSINTTAFYKVNGVQIAMANISDLPNKITAIEGDININTSNISTNSGNISTNTTDISLIQNAITDINGFVNTNIANINNNSNSITTLSTALQIAETQINTNTSNIASKQDILTSSTNISVNQLTFSSLIGNVQPYVSDYSQNYNNPIPYIKTDNIIPITAGQRDFAATDIIGGSTSHTFTYNPNRKQIRLGQNSNTYTGLGPGYQDAAFLWTGHNSTGLDTNSSTYTYGFAFHYASSDGNFYMIKRNNTFTNSNVFRVLRSNAQIHFYVTPTGTSDDRIKFNEKKIENALDTIMKLSPETYDRLTNINDDIVSEFPITNPNPKYLKKESGFIAQEIEQIEELAYLVGETNDGLKNLQYQDLISWSIAGIQELNNKNIELEKEVTILTLRLKSIEDKLGMI